MLLLLTIPLGRVHGMSLLAVTVLGYSFRRGSSLKWVLVILTFEGAIRVGLLFSLCAMAWRGCDARAAAITQRQPPQRALRPGGW